MVRPRSNQASARTAPAGPARRNADETRERILQTAVQEFAAKGYSGGRVDAICASARVNPRMIYHYFGDKDGLYVAVLERVLGELRKDELKLEVDHVDPVEGMKQLFAFVHGHFAQHPELIALLSGENLLKARFLEQSTTARAVSSPLVDLITRLLKRGVKQRAFRSGVDPVQLYVMMVALSYFHRSNAYTLSALFETDITADPWLNKQHKYAEQMILRFVRRDAED